MKTITVDFPPELYTFRSITAYGVKYINSAFEHKKAANAPTDQSEALTATETTETGCREYCTTVAAGRQ